MAHVFMCKLSKLTSADFYNCNGKECGFGLIIKFHHILWSKLCNLIPKSRDLHFYWFFQNPVA